MGHMMGWGRRAVVVVVVVVVVMDEVVVGCWGSETHPAYTATVSQRLTTSLTLSITALIVKKHNGCLPTGFSIFSALTNVTSKQGRSKPLHSMPLTSPTAESSRLRNHVPKLSAVKSDLDWCGDHTMHGLSDGTTFSILAVFVAA